MYSLIRYMLLTLAISAPLAVHAKAPVEPAINSTIRVVCDSDGDGAEVSVNGKFKGECPIDIIVSQGTLNLLVKKKVDELHERVFEQKIRLGSGVDKKIVVVLSAPRQIEIAKQRSDKRPAAVLAKTEKRVAADKAKTAKRDAAEKVKAAKLDAAEKAKAAKLNAAEKAKVAKRVAAEKAIAAKRVAAEKAIAAKRDAAEAQKRAELNADLANLAEQAGRIFRDCAECPKMVVIPSGNFYMGSPSFEAMRQSVEGPLHHVTIGNAFAMGKTEITRGQFAVFAKETGYNIEEKCWTFEGGKYEEHSGRNWRNLGYQQDDSHPAACINWNDAKAYAEWLSHKTGQQYRLPSEAEWEYAARGNTVVVRYQVINPDKTCDYANVMDVTGKAQVPGVLWDAHNCVDGYAYTAPAGSLKPNAFGLYDMIGNVWEWVEDSAHDNYNEAPADGSTWQGNDAKRLLRGGSWSDDAKGSRASARGRGEPTFHNSGIGFRLVRLVANKNNSLASREKAASSIR